MSHDKILKMMASSDLMFFTSIMEATSTVVLEAITVGLPILCFNTCGFGPIVKDFAGNKISEEVGCLNKGPDGIGGFHKYKQLDWSELVNDNGDKCRADKKVL